MSRPWHVPMPMPRSTSDPDTAVSAARAALAGMAKALR